MTESKCIVCGAKIVSQRKRKYCDACKRDRAWDLAKEQEARKVRRKKEAALADLQSTLALSAKVSVATGLSYGQQVLLARQQKMDLRAFLEGMKL